MYYISFADPGRPKGQQFLGGVVVNEDNFLQAVLLAHVLGINPGGEALGVPVLRDDIPPKYINKLLSRAELDEMDAVLAGGK